MTGSAKYNTNGIWVCVGQCFAISGGGRGGPGKAIPSLGFIQEKVPFLGNQFMKKVIVVPISMKSCCSFFVKQEKI